MQRESGNPRVKERRGRKGGRERGESRRAGARGCRGGVPAAGRQETRGRRNKFSSGPVFKILVYSKLF